MEWPKYICCNNKLALMVQKSAHYFRTWGFPGGTTSTSLTKIHQPIALANKTLTCVTVP